jgi:predicted  nucleic acid-binding Zn-ribbon protein
MEASELLQNLRLIVRDEMAPFMERVDAGFDRVHSLFDGVYVRLDRLETEYQALRAGLARIEARLDRVESRLGCVEAELQLVKLALARLEARVSILEARLADVEGKVDHLAPQSEIIELKQQIAMHNDRIAKLEARR